jgi:tetratricopeptide (TPR) repeat protein
MNATSFLVRSSGVIALLAALSAGCAPAHVAPVDPTLRRGQSETELVDRGRAFAALGDWTRAEQYLSAALRQGADARRILPVLVHVCIEASRYRVAAEYVREYLPQDPDNPKLRLLYGMLEAAVGDREAARREYESVLREHPDEPGGHYALAVLLRDNADPVAAGVQFREYLRLSPDGEHASEARAALREDQP